MLSYQSDMKIAILREDKAGSEPRHTTSGTQTSVLASHVYVRCTDPTTTMRFGSPILDRRMMMYRDERERVLRKA
jgi:hypothetical protein